MPYFAVNYTYSPSTAAGRDEHRPVHRAWLGELLTQDVLVSSGPFTDDSGALIVGPLIAGYLIEHGLLTTWGLAAAATAVVGLFLASQHSLQGGSEDPQPRTVSGLEAKG